MSGIKIACPKCNHSIEAAEEMKGTTIECPACKASLAIPNPEFKKCPFCAEEIRFEAVKCKHCGEMLNAQKTASPTPTSLDSIAEPRQLPVSCQAPNAAPLPKVQTIECTSKPLKTQGCLSCVVVAVGAVIIFIAVKLNSSDPPIAVAGAIGFSGCILLVVGLIWAVVTRIRVWWHHD